MIAPSTTQSSHISTEGEHHTVRGGVLTRSPNGLLQTRVTIGVFLSPAVAQELWSNARRRRYPPSWDGQALEGPGLVVEWSERHEAICAGPQCGRRLGRFVAYRVLDEHGLVEDTARSYAHSEAARPPGSHGPRPHPRFRLEGEAFWRSAKTRGVFRCPSCKERPALNLDQLGRRLFASESTTFYV